MAVADSQTPQPASPAVLFDWRRLTQYRLQSLFVVILLIAMGMAWWTYPETYEAYSLLRVRTGPGILYDMDTELMSIEAQEELLRSPLVINAAIADPSVNNLPWIASRKGSQTEVEWLGKQVELRSVGSKKNGVGEVLQISMRGSDPVQLAALVNAVTNAYLDRVAGEERRQLIAQKDRLENAYQSKCETFNRRRQAIRRVSGPKQLRDAASDDDLEPAKTELAALQKVIADLAFRLEQYDLELRSGERITKVQDAAVPRVPVGK